MSTNNEKKTLQAGEDERSVPEFLKNWISEKQLLSIIEINAKTLRNLRYERKLTYSKLFRTPYYYIPDLLLLFESAMVKRE